MSDLNWSVEQATELCMEQMLDLLDGCDDDDIVRPALVIEALRQAWAPNLEIVPLELTAGEARQNIIAARSKLAALALTEPRDA